MWLRFDSTLYINKRVAKKLYKLYTKPYTNPTSHWFSVSCEMYSLCFKLYTNYTLNYTQNPTLRAFAKLYTKRNTNPTFCFWTRISRMEFRKRMERIVRNVCNVRYVRYERKTGNGNRRWRASSLLPSLPLFDSLSLPISFPPPRHSFPPLRHSRAPPQNPTILSHFSAIWH